MSQAPFTVVVTGFGPFGSNTINSSWEIAKELKNLGWESKGIRLHIEQIPVSYATVQKDIPLLWEKLSPNLVIHLGLAASSNTIRLESTAHKHGYCKPDIDGHYPVGGSCNGKDSVLCTQIDLVKLIDKINQNPDVKVSVCLSSNAGRYVCEFTYYTSLNINNYRSLFIHVPDIQKPYSVKEMAQCVKCIILYIIEEISKHLKTKM